MSTKRLVINSLHLKLGQCSTTLLIFMLLSCVWKSHYYVKAATQEGYITLQTRFAKLVGTIERVEFQSEHGYLGSDSEQQIPAKRTYHAFKGIPYAEPPVGNLRWQDPIVKSPLPINALYNATKADKPCPQWVTEGNKTELIGDEDCLYADVYIPATRKTTDLLKILVFLHGGGFIKNSNRNMIPDPLLFQENAIIVMFNYRISIFGYLSTGTIDIPGNYGGLDQITLLKWIQIYGKDFGGNTNDVTVFGSSIGAVSIHYLLLSDLASGLFHRAIMESGSALCERSMVPNPLDIAVKLGSLLMCPSVNPSQLASCLRSASTRDLMMAAKRLTTQWVLPTVLGPVIDRYSRPPSLQLIPDYPERLPVVNKVPVITGITKDEGLTAFVGLSKEFNYQQLKNLIFIQRVILPKYLNLIMRSRMPHLQIEFRHKFIEELTAETMRLYRDDFVEDPILTLTGILGDLWITSCHRKTLESLCTSNVASVYAYLFTHHDPGESPSEIKKLVQEYLEAGINHSILDHGTAHTEEILYMLTDVNGGNSLYKFKRSKMMSEILSNIWTTFGSTTRLLTPMRHLLKSSWPEWNPICQRYNYTDPDFPLYEISLNNHRMFKNYRLQQVEFWWRKHQDTILATN